MRSGPKGWPASLGNAAAAMLAACLLLSVATRLVGIAQWAGNIDVGDMVRIPAASAGVGMTTVATRADGASCVIGVGSLADRGGSLLVSAIANDSKLTAIWSGQGRSSASGSDCGRGHTVTMGTGSFAQLRLAVLRANDRTVQTSKAAVPLGR